MKNEKDFNTIIKNSFEWAYKIPDPQGKFAPFATQRPFDGMAVYKNKPLYWEAKYSNKLQSFNLKSIQDHQLKNLITIKTLIPDSYCWILYGVKIKRGEYRVYLFDDLNDIENRRADGKNFYKTDLEKMQFFNVEHQRVVWKD
jgi:penicillin-binding protein-related factor A (putative recombinase)